MCRGVLLAGTSAALAIAAHAVAGGGLPDTGLTVLLTAGVAAVGVALADRRRSTWTLLAVLGAAQLATHVLLTVDMSGMAGMAAEGLEFNGTTMLIAHMVAVTVSALLLARVDDAVFLAASVFARLLPTVLVPPEPTTPPAVRPVGVPVVPPAAVLLCRGNARRGPPVAA